MLQFLHLRHITVHDPLTFCSFDLLFHIFHIARYLLHSPGMSENILPFCFIDWPTFICINNLHKFVTFDFLFYWLTYWPFLFCYWYGLGMARFSFTTGVRAVTHLSSRRRCLRESTKTSVFDLLSWPIFLLLTYISIIDILTFLCSSRRRFLKV